MTTLRSRGPENGAAGRPYPSGRPDPPAWCGPRPAAAEIVRRVRALTGGRGRKRPPFPPEKCAAQCGVIEVVAAPVRGGIACLRPPRGRAPGGTAGRQWVLVIDPRLPPHTPQWNGAVALGLARALLPRGAGGAAADELAEIGAAELLLPMRVFGRAAARTDLTMDGLRDLALRFSAPIRLAVRQWLRTGTWRGYALLWRREGGAPVLRWRAASPSLGFPRTLVIGATAGAVWSAGSRLYATLRTGRPHHGVEEVRTGAGPAWWFTRFGVVRSDAGEPGGEKERGGAVLALVILDRGP